MTLFDFLGILSLFLFVLFVFLSSRYNGFIKLKNQVEEDFADIDIQLQRRSDLIGQLIEVVKGYAKHEKTVFKEVTELRSKMSTEQSVSQLAQFEKQTVPLVGTISALAENYPDLKANKSYQLLMENMKQTENSIAEFRKEYNTSVKKFNSSLQTFPNSVAKNVFGFTYAEFFSFNES